MEAKLNKAAIVFEARYNVAKEAAVKSTIECPVCKKKHTKTTYHKIFCSNGKTRKGGNCKDKYWNVVDEIRRIKMLKKFKHDIKSEELKEIEMFFNL